MLQTHAAFALLPCGDWLDVGHAWQVTPVVEATAVEYMSASHEMQSLEPEMILYLPAGHAEQCPPFNPVNPALHSQSSSTSLPKSFV
jgi:hypothetical protein